jgi:hypothetical protein
MSLRQRYGLGSKLKSFARKIIPNEISEIAVKAAPFVAPFNPLLAAGMAGIGGFDQTGRIGSSLKSAASDLWRRTISKSCRWSRNAKGN